LTNYTPHYVWRRWRVWRMPPCHALLKRHPNSIPMLPSMPRAFAYASFILLPPHLAADEERLRGLIQAKLRAWQAPLPPPGRHLVPCLYWWFVLHGDADITDVYHPACGDATFVPFSHLQKGICLRMRLLPCLCAVNSPAFLLCLRAPRADPHCFRSGLDGMLSHHAGTGHCLSFFSFGFSKCLSGRDWAVSFHYTYQPPADPCMPCL